MHKGTPKGYKSDREGMPPGLARCWAPTQRQIVLSLAYVYVLVDVSICSLRLRERERDCEPRLCHVAVVIAGDNYQPDNATTLSCYLCNARSMEGNII